MIDIRAGMRMESLDKLGLGMSVVKFFYTNWLIKYIRPGFNDLGEIDKTALWQFQQLTWWH